MTKNYCNANQKFDIFGLPFAETLSLLKRFSLKGVMLVALSLLMTNSVEAQVSVYNFSQSVGTYTPITGGTWVPSTPAAPIDDNVVGALPIGFTFSYNGTDYTQFGYNGNGWISMGSGTPSTSYTAISSGTTNNVISAFNVDLVGFQYCVASTTIGSNVLNITSGNPLNLAVGSPITGTNIPTGTTIASITATTITLSANATGTGTGIQTKTYDGGIRYETLGTAPNRKLVVQFTNFGRYISSGANGDKTNFQIVLNEGSNTIQFIYDVIAPTATTASTIQVGLRGASTSAYKNRASTTDWSATTNGTSSSASVTFRNTIVPVSGLTFNFSPPTCLAPVSLSVADVTSTSFSVYWSEPSIIPAEGYNYEVRTTGAAGSGATGLITSGNTAAGVTFFDVTGLTAETSYTVYVRSNCGAGDVTTWASVVGYTGYCIPPAPSGNGTYINNFSTTAGVANISNLASGFTTGGYSNLYNTAEVSSFEGNLVNYSYSLVGGTAGVAIWIDWNNDLVFSDSERIFGTTTYQSAGTYTGTISIPAGTALGSYRMRIRTDFNASPPTSCTNGGTRTETEDYKFTVVAQPSCLAPLNLVSSNLTITTATISWEASASLPANGYQYEVRTSGDAGSGTTGLVASGSTASGVISASITGLTASTSYVFYVRSMCATGTSAWAASAPFLTPCDSSPVPYVMPIEAVTVPALPLCTSVQNVNNDNRTWISAATTSGITGKVMSYPYNSTQAANDWLYTNGLNLVAGTSYRLKFKYKDTGYAEKLKVAIGNSADYNAMTTQLFDVTTGSGTTTVSQRVDFTVPADGTYFIGFQCYSALNQNVLYLGEVSVELTPTDAVDFANLQSFVVGSTEVNSIQTCQSVIAYAQAYEPNVTEPDGAAAGLLAWVGYSTTDTDPATWPASAWRVATYNVNVGNNDEFSVTYNNLAAGTYYFASRFQLNDGPYRYGASNNGFWNATTNPNKALTVTTPEAITATSSQQTICSGVSSNLTASSANTNYTYTWNNGAGTGAAVTVNPTTTTTYTVTGTDSISGCTSTATVTVTVNPAPSQVVVTPSATSVCRNEVVALTSSGATYVAESTIGTATTATSTSAAVTAFNNRFDHYWMQMVFTAAELTAAGVQPGNISGLKFNITSVGSAPNVTDFHINIGTTTNNALTAFTTTGLTEVFSAATYTQAIGVNAINFTTPYMWDGTSNIIVDIRQTGIDSSSNAETLFTATTGTNTVVYAITSSANAGGSNGFVASNPAAVTSTSRLNTTFMFDDTANVSWSPTTDLFTDAAATVAYTAGSFASVVYAKPQVQTDYTATASVGTCSNTASVSLNVTSTDAPTGTSPQDFTSGDTLADFTVVGTGIVWYDAATNGNILPATTVIVQGASYYAAQVVNGCESAERLLVVAGTDLKVDGFDNASFKYYPNPVSNILNVSYSEEISGLKLYNLVGQQLLVKKANATQTQIDMTQLPAGTYLLEVTSGTKVKTVKVIKNN